MSTEAMKLALAALEETRNALAWFYDSYPQDVTKKGNKLLPHVETVLTTLREALAQPQQEPVADEVRCPECGYLTKHTEHIGCLRKKLNAINAFEQRNFAIVNMDKAPPAQQEPVEYWTVANGWVSDQAEVPAAVWVEPDFWEHCNRVNCGTAYRLPAPGRQPLYTSPPAQRKPLTDEQIETVWRSVQANDFHDCVKPFARAIEAAHGIKGDA